MLRLLWNPGSIIDDLRAKPSAGLITFILVISALIMSGSIVLLSFVLPNTNLLLQTSVAVFLGVIISTLYLAFLITATMKALSGNGNYTAGLTSLSLPLFPISVAMLLASIAYIVHTSVAFISVTYPVWGVLGLLTPFLIVLSLSTLFHALKELFETNIITAILGFIILNCTAVFLVILATTPYWLPLLQG